MRSAPGATPLVLAAGLPAGGPDDAGDVGSVTAGGVGVGHVLDVGDGQERGLERVAVRRPLDVLDDVGGVRQVAVRAVVPLSLTTTPTPAPVTGSPPLRSVSFASVRTSSTPVSAV